MAGPWEKYKAEVSTQAEGPWLQYQNDQAPSVEQAQSVDSQPSLKDQLVRSAGLAGRAIVSGLSAPANIVGEFLTGAGNLGLMAAGSEKRIPSMAAAQQQALTQMGLPVPETTQEKMTSGAMEALAGGALMPGAATAKGLASMAAGGAVAQPVAEEVTTLTGNELLGTLAGAGASLVAGGATGKGIGAVARAWDEKLPTIQEVKQRAQQNYAKLDQYGVTVKPKSVLDMVGGMETALKDANYIPKTDTKIANALDTFREIVGTERVPFTTVEKLRSIATNLSNDTDMNTKRLGKVMVNTIDDYINTLSGKDIIAGKEGVDKSVKAVTEARKDWRNASKAQILQDILDVADIKGQLPQKSESELIRANLSNMLANKSKRAMFTDAEINTMKSVINGGPIDVLASFIGRFNPLRPFGAAGSGGVAMGTGDVSYGAAMAGAGLLTDTAQSLLKRRAMDRLIRGLASGTITEQPNYKYQGLLGGVIGGQ